MTPSSAASPAQTLPGIPANAFEMTVESVHDGDTLRAHVSAPNAAVTNLESTRVRLLGVDTPEISPVAGVLGRRGDRAADRAASGRIDGLGGRGP